MTGTLAGDFLLILTACANGTRAVYGRWHMLAERCPPEAA